jgi:hypothetical protein
MEFAMPQTEIGKLYPIYKRYIDEHLIPHASAHPSYYGPAASTSGYEEALKAMKTLMNNDPYALDGISAEAMGAVAWVAIRSIGLIQNFSDHSIAVQEGTETDQLLSVLKAVWPTSAALNLRQPTLH